MPLTRRPRPYLERPRRFRRDRFVAQRWRAAQDPDGQGVFACRHLLPGTPGWRSLGLSEDATQVHADVRFVSRRHAKAGWWYAARLVTVEQIVLEALERRIDEGLEQRLAAQGLTYADAFPWRQPVSPLQALAGPDGSPRTGWEARGDAWRALTPADWECLELHEGAFLDFKRPHAVGLTLVLPVPTLDVAAVRDAVTAFLERGETETATPIAWAAHRDAIQAGVHREAYVCARLAG